MLPQVEGYVEFILITIPNLLLNEKKIACTTKDYQSKKLTEKDNKL